MYHPIAAAIDCRVCHEFHVNLETGKIETRGTSGVQVKRAGPPPCSRCPKKSPEIGKTLKLHWRNRKLVAFYHLVQTFGSIPDQYKNDPLTLENLDLIRRLQVEADGQAELDKQIRLENLLAAKGK
jgi:hypothetical protein